MKMRNKWITAFCSVAMVASMATVAAAEETPVTEPERAAQVIVAEEHVEETNGEPGIRKVYTVNHIYGDGQKV